MCGRPRRLAWYFRSDQTRGMIAFGKRSSVNTVIQGSGADVLKMAFLNLYKMFYSNPATRNTNRKYVKFLNTVHDLRRNLVVSKSCELKLKRCQ